MHSSVSMVLSRFPVASFVRSVTPLGNAGGFSSARLWRIECAAGTLCLKARSKTTTDASRLQTIHQWTELARNAGLRFVPQVFSTSDHGPHLDFDGCYWELSEWMPGVADFHEAPSNAKLVAACHALAQIHQVWTSQSSTARCPAIKRRFESLANWHRLIASGWQPHFSLHHEELNDIARRAWQLLPLAMDRLPQRLVPWIDQAVRVQPCLCDIWHDHVLFVKDNVSGIIDYGSAKVDHVAVDLARLLGSLIGDETDRWQVALEAYREVRPLSDEEWHLARQLDITGLTVAVANWLVWLYYDNRPFVDLDSVSFRLNGFVERLGLQIQ